MARKAKKPRKPTAAATKQNGWPLSTIFLSLALIFGAASTYYWFASPSSTAVDVLAAREIPEVEGAWGTCSINDVESNGDCVEEMDPSLRKLSFEGDDSFYAFVPPDVSTFYNEKPGNRRATIPVFNGLAGKFVNLSPQKLAMYWEPIDKNRDLVLIADVGPFESVGTATYPNHQFIFVDPHSPKNVKARFIVSPPNNTYVYEMSEGFDASLLTPEQLQMYTVQKRNLEFAAEYKALTGREWLSLYPRRKRPVHKMWRADYFGHKHIVETRETHFTSLPPVHSLEEIKQRGSRRRQNPNEPRVLEEFRAPSGSLNLTLKTLSCSPRVFEIKNFLSDVEADHILNLATGLTLSRSTTSAGASSSRSSNTETRTSKNTWVDREMTPIVDSIYRRAADVLRIDEALLRDRSPDEFPHLPRSKSMAESLQLVHYDVGQQYTPHHDWRAPSFHNQHQNARFATLLLYLNEGMEGGETAFPRWVNAHTSGFLKVKPEKGKAILFYSLLPDGNMDDLSQHSAMPVTKGEKWLTNLWVWDPDVR